MCVFFFSFVANFFYICSTGCLMQWCLFRLFLRFVLHTLLLFSSSLSNSPSLLLLLLYAWIPVYTQLLFCAYVCMFCLCIYAFVVSEIWICIKEYNTILMCFFFFMQLILLIWSVCLSFSLAFNIWCCVRAYDIMHISTMRAIFFFFWFFEWQRNTHKTD